MNDHHHVYATVGVTVLGEAMIWLAKVWQYVDLGEVYATHALLMGAAYYAWKRSRK